MMVPLFMRERPGEKRFPWDEGEAVEEEDGSKEISVEVRDFITILGNIRTAFSVRSAQLGIAVSLVISLAFILIPILPLLFLQELLEPRRIQRYQRRYHSRQYHARCHGGRRTWTPFGGKSMLMYAALALP